MHIKKQVSSNVVQVLMLRHSGDLNIMIKLIKERLKDSL